MVSWWTSCMRVFFRNIALPDVNIGLAEHIVTKRDCTHLKPQQL